MKKTLTFLFALLFLAGFKINYAQAPDWTRVLQASSYGAPIGSLVTADANYIYITGNLNGPVTFGGVSMLNVGTQDLMISKINNSGVTSWTKQFNAKANGSIIPKAIKTDAAGNIYISCSFEGSVTIGSSTVTSDAIYNSFIAKFDANGNGKWVTAHSYDGTDNSKIAVDGSGNSFLISGASKLDKFNSSGVLQWEQFYPDKTLKAIAVYGSELFIGGMLQPGNNTIGSFDLFCDAPNKGFLAKADLNGIYNKTFVEGGPASSPLSTKQAWYHSTGYFTHPVPANSRAIDLTKALIGVGENVLSTTVADLGTYEMLLTINPDNTVIVSGSISGTQPLYASGINIYDPATETFTLNYSYDAAAGGNPRIISEVLTRFSDYYSLSPSSIADITFDIGGNMLITGDFNTELVLGPIYIYNDSYYHTFIAKCNSNFDFAWATGSSRFTNAYVPVSDFKVFTDNSNNIYEYIPIADTITFGSVRIPVNTDKFLVKFDAAGTATNAYGIKNATPNKVFISPAGKILTLDSYDLNGTPVTGSLYLNQYSEAMNLEWQNKSTASQPGSIYLGYVKNDSLGNTYSKSNITGYCDFFGTSITTNKTIIAKHDIAGNLLWTDFVPGDYRHDGPRIALDKDNNVLTAGFFDTTLTIGNKEFINQNTQMDFCIAKHSTDGQFIWAEQLNTTNDLEISCITSDKQGNVIVSGNFMSQFNIQGITIDAGTLQGAFILKFNSTGTLIWAKGYPVAEAVYRALVCTDANNNIYMGADVENYAAPASITLGTVTTPQVNNGSTLLAKFDSNGNPLWANTYGNVSGIPDYAGWITCMQTDALGNSYIIGSFNNNLNVNFGAYTLTNPIADYKTNGTSIFLTKINTEGTVLWVQAVYQKNSGYSWCDLIDLDKAGNIYIGGHFNDLISIDGNIIQPEGLNDAFIAKYSNNGTYNWVRTIPSNAQILNSISVLQENAVTVAVAAGKNPTLGSFPVTKKGGSTYLIATLGNFIKADFSFSSNPANRTVSFTDLSSKTCSEWIWTMGDGKVIKTQNPVYQYSKPGLYTVCLSVFDPSSSLSTSICKEVIVGETSCQVTADFDYEVIPLARVVTFISKTTGSVTDYNWTFGDGTSSSLENPDHQYLTAGAYTVKLVVRNSVDGCMNEVSRLIQVGSVDCLADFTYRVNHDNLTVEYLDNSKAGTAYYYWDFGDGTFNVDKNPVHIYSKAGIYTTSLTVIDIASGCVDNTFQQVQVGSVDCSADFVSYIDSASFTGYFTNRILGNSTALLWTFGDGKFSTKENPIHVFPGEGIYSVGLNTYDLTTECMDYYEEMLLIGGLGEDCEADFAFGVDPTTPEVRFSNKSIGDIVSTAWNFGEYGSDNSAEMNPSHTYIKGGYYNVCLTVTNSSGISNMSCKWVLVQGSAVNDCRANFMFSIDSASREVVFVDNSFGDINKYTWDFGDNGSVTTDKNPIHTYGQAGYYLVQLKAENTVTGCVSNEYKLLNVADEQVLKAAFGYEAKVPDKKFAGYPVDLVSASSGDGATVEWDFGDKQIKKEFKYVMDSTSRIVTHYYANPGRYEVCLKISDPVSNQSDVYCSFVYTKNAIGIDQVMKSGINLSIYPNPLIDYTTITYALEKPQFIEISIYDQLGRKIETLVKSRQDSGASHLTWDTKTLPTGVYHLKLLTAEGIITKQLVIAK